MSKTETMTVDITAQTLIDSEVRLPRMTGTIATVVSKLKPYLLASITANETLEKNTHAIALRVREAFDLYKKTDPNGTRVGFARMFDPTISADAKTRDLGSNKTYNHINYLIDRVAGPTTFGEETEEDRTERVTAEQRWEKAKADWQKIRRKYRGKAVQWDEVEALVKTLLADIAPRRAEQIFEAA